MVESSFHPRLSRIPESASNLVIMIGIIKVRRAISAFCLGRQRHQGDGSSNLSAPCTKPGPMNGLACPRMIPDMKISGFATKLQGVGRSQELEALLLRHPPPPPPPVLGMSDLATENLDLTGFERAVGILWTSSGFPRHPLASKMWWWWTLMDSGQLATVARTDLIKSDLHGSDQSTELVRSRHFDISVHRVQSRFILGLMTSRDGIFKVGAIWYQALTWIWGTNMEQVEYISIWLSCNGNAYKSYIEVGCAQCTLESGWVYLEFSLARACSVFWFPQSFNGNICIVL